MTPRTSRPRSHSTRPSSTLRTTSSQKRTSSVRLRFPLLLVHDIDAPLQCSFTTRSWRRTALVLHPKPQRVRRASPPRFGVSAGRRASVTGGGTVGRRQLGDGVSRACGCGASPRCAALWFRRPRGRVFRSHLICGHQCPCLHSTFRVGRALGWDRCRTRRLYYLCGFISEFAIWFELYCTRGFLPNMDGPVVATDLPVQQRSAREISTLPSQDTMSIMFGSSDVTSFQYLFYARPDKRPAESTPHLG